MVELGVFDRSYKLRTQAGGRLSELEDTPSRRAESMLKSMTSMRENACLAHDPCHARWGLSDA